MVTRSEILKLPDQKEAVETVADYLSRIYAHIQHYISEVVGPMHSNLRNIIRVPIDFWFTIPASWSEETQLLMRQGIQRAGFGTSHLHQV